MKIWRSSMDVGVAPDVKITQGLEGSLGTRRSRKDPEVTWEPVGFPLDPGIMIGARRLYDDPKGFPLDPEIVSGPWCLCLDLEVIWEPGDRNLEVLPQILRSLLGTRRLSGNPESLTGLEGAGVGVMTQVPGFAAFHVWISRDYEGPRCALGCTGVLGLARNGGIWRPDPARMPL
ncbi:hypothetical protein F2Q68_00031004 [Brassica cretica]|uniref:Uncharacterized protein n=1 Tax=Brassica cretica TaxID=69181 RepID=A0A8S9G9N1_BRACR|nr:hypothetical protein F2Q68_00031004 [Brassica cretica]